MTTTRLLEIQLHSFWHIGSSAPAGTDVDAEPTRTAEGLPYLPGRSIRGLVRDAMQKSAVFDGGGADLQTWFGSEPSGTVGGQSVSREGDLAAARWSTKEGQVHFGNGVLGRTEPEQRAWCSAARKDRRLADALFQRIAQTAVDEKTGVAKDTSLRSRRVAVPMVLHAPITARGEPAQTHAFFASLADSLDWIAELGGGRTRGMGRVRMRLLEQQTAPALRADQDGPKVEGECALLVVTLIDPVAASATAASTGGHEALDYLPGASLLGAAAAALYAQMDQTTAWQVFHSGAVQFGDGRPVMPGNMVARRSGLARHAPKGEPGKLIDLANANRAEYVQYVQERSSFCDAEGEPFHPTKTYGLRTALDDGKPREGFLYGYEALEAGQRFVAELRAEHPELLATVCQALNGQEVRLGRGRAAEYGRALIRVLPGQSAAAAVAPESKQLSILCSSDLCLVGASGQPRLALEPADVGLPAGWKCLWDRTYVRRRSWRPFNGTRGLPGMERQALAAGSVVTFCGPALSATQASRVQQFLDQGVGLFRAEGLGRLAHWGGNEPLLQVPPDDQADSRSAGHTLANDSLHAFAKRRLVELDRQDRESTEIAKVAAGLARYKLPKAQWGALRQWGRENPGQVGDKLDKFFEGNVRNLAWARRRGGTTAREALVGALAQVCGDGPSGTVLARLAAAVASANERNKGDENQRRQA